MRSLKILENTPQQMLAVQTSSSAAWFNYSLIAAALLAIAWCVWAKQWKALIAPVIILVVFSFFASLPSTPMYRLRIDFAHGQITSEGSRKATIVSSFTVRGTDLSAAEMQSNRGATAIALIKRDGSLLYPLGDEYLQDEPDQYVVLTALRDVITPVAGAH